MTDQREITRIGYEPFECGPALRLSSHEKLSKLQIDSLNGKIERLEGVVERLEKRLWLCVFGVVGAVLAQAFLSIIEQLP